MTDEDPFATEAGTLYRTYWHTQRRITVLFASILLGCVLQLQGKAAASAPPPDLPNLLLVTIDTLRADHVGCYGYDSIETPNLDKLAEAGYLFENAFTTAPVTAPSHASILTGTYPTYHGVRDNGNYILDPFNVTLAEILLDRGYQTAAFVSTFVLDRRFGLFQGFELYNDDFSEGICPPSFKNKKWMGHRFDNFERDASQVNQAALPWLEAHGTERFFLWVHYYDPHKEYSPPEPWATRYSGRPYDGEIAYTDYHLGALLDTLDRTGVRDQTLVVLVSDHGEGLGQHEPTHGLTLFDSVIRVLFILVPPGGLSEGQRIQREVRTIDLFPTLLDYMGLSTSGVVHGCTLKSYIESDDPRKPRHGPPLYCETHHYERPYRGGILRALRDPFWKYVVSDKNKKFSLFSLKENPGETRNVFRDHTSLGQKIDQRMRTIIRVSGKDGEEVNEEISMDKGTVEKLKALGYIR